MPSPTMKNTWVMEDENVENVKNSRNNSNNTSTNLYNQGTEWNSRFLKALDYDERHESQRAIRIYSRLLRSIDEALSNEELHFTNEQKNTVMRISVCFQRRRDTLLNNGNNNKNRNLSYDELLKLKPVLKIFPDCPDRFPIPMEQKTGSCSSLQSNDSGLCNDTYIEEDSDILSNTIETPKLTNMFQCQDLVKSSQMEELQLFCPLKRCIGLTRFSIMIDKINLKDANLVNPYITISLRDGDSVNLSPLQNANQSTLHGNEIHFNSTVHTQRYLEKIPKGSFMYFELWHTTKKNKAKVKCYGVLGSNLFVTGVYKLGLYKPPVDYHRKNLVNLSKKNKPLFLHIQVKVESQGPFSAF